MRRALFLALVVTAAPATAQPPADQPQLITVTGARIQDFRDRLAACLARHCPANEDADATLALAEALFLNGAYGEARREVRASLGRNNRLVRQYPEPVADLYRAHARLSRHLGYDDQAARSTYSILRSLEAGIPEEDHRHFTARFEIADLQMTMGNPNRARGALAELIRIARAAGREDVATLAELRTLWFDYAVDAYGDAKPRLIAMTRLTGPADRMRALGARLLLARIYRTEGDAARADALLAEVGRGSGARHLISAPSYQLQMRETQNIGEIAATSDMSGDTLMAYSNASSRAPDNFQDKWIDVGFWVMPDGRVSGLEIQRRRGETQWADPLIESIRGRVYSSAPEPTYRLERYTYTSGYETATGTRVLRHSPRARVEYLDLTVNAPADPERPAPPGAPSGGAVR